MISCAKSGISLSTADNACSCNIGRSFLLPVSIIRTGVAIVNDFVSASAQKAHPPARQSLTVAPLPG